MQGRKFDVHLRFFATHYLTTSPGFLSRLQKFPMFPVKKLCLYLCTLAGGLAHGQAICSSFGHSLNVSGDHQCFSFLKTPALYSPWAGPINSCEHLTARVTSISQKCILLPCLTQQLKLAQPQKDKKEEQRLQLLTSFLLMFYSWGNGGGGTSQL